MVLQCLACTNFLHYLKITKWHFWEALRRRCLHKLIMCIICFLCALLVSLPENVASLGPI